MLLTGTCVFCASMNVSRVMYRMSHRKAPSELTLLKMRNVLRKFHCVACVEPDNTFEKRRPFGSSPNTPKMTEFRGCVSPSLCMSVLIVLSMGAIQSCLFALTKRFRHVPTAVLQLSINKVEPRLAPALLSPLDERAHMTSARRRGNTLINEGGNAEVLRADRKEVGENDQHKNHT